MKNSRTKNSLMNMTASIVYQILNLVLSFVSRTVFLQVLGVGYLGINGLFSDILSMLNMAELGLGTAMTYSMYKPLAENDQETLAGLTNFYEKVYRIIAFSIAGIGIMLLPILPHLINLEQNIPNIELYYLLFLASNVASYFVVAKTTVLYADQKNHILIKYSAYWHVAQIATMLLVLWLTKNYTIYLIVQLFFIYGQNIHKSHVAVKSYPFLSKKIILPKEKTNSIFKDVGSAFIYKTANVLISATDNMLTSILVSTEMVGYYSNYSILIGKISGISGTLFTSLTASIGNLIAKEDAKQRYRVFQIMQTLGLILSTFCVTCLLLLEDDFIRVWLGTEYTLDFLTLIAAVINFYFYLSLTPVTTFREAAGLFRRIKFLMLWTAMLNIVFSIIMGIYLGLSGILFATSLSKLLTCFWFEPKILFEDYFQKPCHLFFLEMLRNVGVTIFSVGFARLTTFWLVPQDWLQLVFKGIMVALASVMVIILCYHKTEGFEMLCVKMTELLSRFVKRRRK